ncbi:hypothetical protein U8Y98_25965 [Priestia megaterium]|uniref:hypothetical protein n=1 Tax=Priestia megaterium TaxID=1404 RepID=UPI002FDFD042
MKEIGSEYWIGEVESKEFKLAQVPSWLDIGNANEYLLSGRTAIDLVLKDILYDKKVSTVYFPSYCCQSMLQPFIDNDIQIELYNVYSTNSGLKFEIDINHKCDIFFAMNYFGYSDGRMDYYIENFNKREVIVIEDVTHSLLSPNSYNNKSDYRVASLRKWFPVFSGGLAAKSNGNFNIKASNHTLDEMIMVRKNAMFDKARYMNRDTTVKKDDFLQKYSVANKMLNENYSLYKIDDDSFRILNEINIKKIIEVRRKNAQVIHDFIKETNEIKPMFPNLTEDDCPIFIPVLLNENIRNHLREYLIKHKVYYPIHWPKPEIVKYHSTCMSIYDIELSLICDQRYNDYDIKDSINEIKRFFKESSYGI